MVLIDAPKSGVYFDDVAKRALKRAKVRSKMKDQIAEAILDAAASQDKGPYDLAKAVKDSVGGTTVYQFMREKGTLRTDVASRLMDALGLVITSKENLKK